MTSRNANEREGSKEEKLPRRDWLLLPMLSLLTISLILGLAQLTAQWLFPESEPNNPASPRPVVPVNDGHAIPNSVYWQKGFESELVQYRFNSCGHRTDIECGQKPSGTYRIVMVGSSVAMGYPIQLEKTLAALLPIELSRLTERKIDLYNESLVGVNPHVQSMRMNEVLAARPDMILMIITPLDMDKELPDTEVRNPLSESSSPLQRAWFRLKTELASKSVSQVARDLSDRELVKISDTSFGTLLLHSLYESRSQYLKSSLMGPQAGFMLVPTTAEWQTRLDKFDSDFAEIARQAKADGIPVVVTLVPNRAQVTMISLGEWPAGYDPYKLDGEMRRIVMRHGGIYLDILPDYRNIPNPEKGYFPVDGHPNAEGHALLARILSQDLTRGAIPALQADREQAASSQGR